ncbi:MAG: DNA-directed RNA polymerase subunit P [Methanocellales archaeon]|nr:DNA-directed RNA polymerase subunit P [Methanocellales archaeon]
MVYKCTGCKRVVEINSEYGGVRCPYCGHRVLLKERGTIIKRVKAE